MIAFQGEELILKCNQCSSNAARSILTPDCNLVGIAETGLEGRLDIGAIIILRWMTDMTDDESLRSNRPSNLFLRTHSSVLSHRRYDWLLHWIRESWWNYAQLGDEASRHCWHP
jgi:hypothetical protein